MRWAGHVACMGEERGVYRVFVGKPEGRRPMGRPRRRWVDNIRTDLQEVGCGYMDWIWLAQDRDRWRTLVSAVMNLRVSWNAGNISLFTIKVLQEIEYLALSETSAGNMTFPRLRQTYEKQNISPFTRKLQSAMLQCLCNEYSSGGDRNNKRASHRK